MTRPTLQQCQDQLAAFAATEFPEDWVTVVEPIRVGEARLTALLVFWEGREANAIPREARLVFGLDQRLLMAFGLDPGLFMHAVEEGFEIKEADTAATHKLASFDDVFKYLLGRPYRVENTLTGV